MNVIYKSTLYKCFAVVRFLLLRIFYVNRLSVARLSMIGKRCGIYIQGNGSMKCRGRIIVNDDVVIQTKGELIIGKQFGINSYSRITAHEKITIGHNVTIGQMVSILDHDHHYEIQGGNLRLNGYDTAPINIGSNVWIGDKVTILKGVTIGNNVVVAANAVVNKDVPEGSIVGGIPCKVLKKIS